MCLSVCPHGEDRYLPWTGGGVPILDGGGGTYLGPMREYLPWMGGGGTYLGQGTGVPTLDGRERGYLPWMGVEYLTWTGGIPTLDRMCHGMYVSCGFPQEDFLV